MADALALADALDGLAETAGIFPPSTTRAVAEGYVARLLDELHPEAGRAWMELLTLLDDIEDNDTQTASL